MWASGESEEVRRSEIGKLSGSAAGAGVDRVMGRKKRGRSVSFMLGWMAMVDDYECELAEREAKMELRYRALKNGCLVYRTTYIPLLWCQ